MNLIDLVKQKWKRIKFFESTIIAIAIAVVCLELLAVFSNLSSFVISTITFAAFIVSFFLITKIKAINAIKSADISSFLNTEFPQLQFSSQLIEQDDIVLTELARYQKQRLLSALPEIDSIKIPNQFKSLLIVLTGTLIFSLLIRFYGHDIVQTLSRSDHSTVINSAVSDKLLPVVLSEAEITIEAPVYTKIATKSQSDFNVLAPESSVLHFRFKFSAEIKRAFLLINQRDTIKLKVLESVVKTSYRLNHSGFYSILWQTEKQDFASDFYQLNVVKDQPPEIDING
ncbi:MAG: hypothetical protein KDD94_13820, partial [Calditrichaeota bacterium]|nr:hypothetical protein [Calditrichota bacterium]